MLNRQPQIAELKPEGQLLRIIELEGAKDPAGITSVRGATHVVPDEDSHGMYWVQIGADALRVSVEGHSSLDQAIDTAHNSRFEGMSWDSRNHRLYVVKEELPLRVLMVSGLDVFDDARGFNMHLRGWRSSRSASLFMSDLSSLTLHAAPTRQLRSEESALMAE